MPADMKEKLKYFKEKVKSKKEGVKPPVEDDEDDDDMEDSKASKSPKISALVIALDRKMKKGKDAKRSSDC